MSWSISFIGNRSNVITAIENESEKLTGVSKTEYDAVKDHIKGLVEANFNMNKEGIPEPVISVTANGHGTFSEGNQLDGNCSCKVERFYTRIV